MYVVILFLHIDSVTDPHTVPGINIPVEAMSFPVSLYLIRCDYIRTRP